MPQEFEQQQVRDEEEVHLRDYLRVVQKHKWTVVACFLFCLISSIVFVYSQDPLYKATVKVQIEKSSQRQKYLEEILVNAGPQIDYFQTEFEIIKSRRLAGNLTQRVDFSKYPEFNPELQPKPEWHPVRLWQNLKTSIQDLFPAEADQVEDAGSNATKALYVGQILERTSVERIPESNIVKIHFQARNPRLAARAANTMARVYIKQDIQRRAESSQAALQWLYGQLQEEQERSQEAETRLLRFKDRHNVLFFPDDETEGLTTQKIMDYREKLDAAETERIKAEYRYQQATRILGNPHLLETSNLIQGDTSIQSVNEKIFLVKSQLREASRTFGPNHPKIKALKTELSAWMQERAGLVKQLVEAVAIEYELAQAREQQVAENLEAYKASLFDLNKEAVEYHILKNQADHAREMYNTLLKNFKKVSINNEQADSNISIVEEAIIPKSPINRKSRNVALGAVLGLMLGLGLSFFFEYLDNTLKTPEDVANHLHLPFLSAIPAMDRLQEQGFNLDKVVHESPRASASEAYRGLRTAVLFSGAEKAPQVILVTSAVSGEGKSQLCSNLALTLADFGAKVLLVDCDLRKPSQHQVFGLLREPGLTNALASSSQQEQELVQASGLNKLEILPSGTLPPNPSELLGSERMHSFLNSLRTRFDQIIIDSPPVTAVTDPVVLAQQCDGVIYVTRGAETSREVAAQGVSRLEGVRANFLGVVLNNVDLSKDGYYYKYYYYTYYSDDGQKQQKKRRDRGRHPQ